MNSIHKVYLGLGSNLGDREANLLKAITMIGERIGNVVRQSTFIETEPWGFESKNAFLNAVILCETPLTPRQLLRATQKIERLLGRKNKSTVPEPAEGPEPAPLTVPEPAEGPIYHDRPIDIDILLYDDLVIDEPDLKIPHPLMQERDFVMIPLNEIK